MDKLEGVVRRLGHLARHLVAGGGEGGGRGVEAHAAEGDVGGRRRQEGVAFAGQNGVQISVGEWPGGEVVRCQTYNQKRVVFILMRTFLRRLGQRR